MKFKNAKIIGRSVDPKVYRASVGETAEHRDAERGDREFIMSRSELMSVLLCPERWRNGYSPKGSDSMEWGDWIDCRTLDPARFATQFTTAPSTYPCEPTKKDPRTEKPWNRNATYCQEWEEERAKSGVTAIKSADMANIEAAAKSLRQKEAVSELIRCSDCQVFIMAEWEHKPTGLVIPIKALLDLVPEKDHPRFGETLADLKTSTSANPARWPKTVFTYGYDAQAALYMDIFNAATGEQRIQWAHVVQENFPPYQVADPLPLLSSEFIDLGRARYQAALNLYANCLATNTWPPYAPTRTRIDVFQIVGPESWMPAAVMDTFPELAVPSETDSENDVPIP